MDKTNQSNKEGYTSKFSKLIVNANYSSLPQKVVKRAKAAIMDCTGVMLVGSREDAPKILVKVIQQLGGNEQCSIVGTSIKTSAPFAAWANGTAGHALEFDDAGGDAWSAHPSTVVYPAVLAVGESLGVGGKEIILAYVVGLETGARIGRACQEGGTEYGRLSGWHNTSTIGSLATAAASAKLLKLNSEETSMALGIASSFASGLLKANIGTMTKPMHPGHAASNGIKAALLAQSGFTASKSALEGTFGFCKMFTGGREIHFDKLINGFGDPWDIESPGIMTKPYPCCRGNHSSIDAAFYLRNLKRFTIEQIEEIVLRTSKQLPEILCYHRPETTLEAKFSLEYCVAIALLEGEVRLKHFLDDSWLKKKMVQELIRKARYEHPPDIGTGMDLPQEVVIRTKNGKQYSMRVTQYETKGHPDNPMTEEELLAKYRDCTGYVLSEASIKTSTDILRNLESLDSISKLIDTFKKD